MDFFFGDESIIAYLRKKRRGDDDAPTRAVSDKEKPSSPGTAPAARSVVPGLSQDRDRTAIDILLLLVFLLIGYFIRKALFVGMAWSDDFDYAQIAVMIVDGRYNPVDIGQYNLYGWRFAMVFPMALLFKIFNSTSESVAALWPLLSSLGTAVCLYAIGRMLFSSRAGLIAALLHLLYPSDILFSTCVLTETPFNLIIALSVLFFVIGEQSKQLWVKPLFFLLSGGISVFLLYGRPYGIMIIGAYGLFMLLRYRINLWYLFILIGAAGALYLIEYTVHEYTGTWGGNFTVMKRMLDPYFCPTSNITSHLDFYRDRLFNDRMHHPHFYIMIIGSGVLFNWALFRDRLSAEKPKDDEARKLRHNGFFVLLWLMSILLYIEFGFMNIDHMTLMHKLDRYLTIVSAPICLGAAPFLARYSNRYSLAITAVMLTAISIWWYFSVMPENLKALVTSFP